MCLARSVGAAARGANRAAPAHRALPESSSSRRELFNFGKPSRRKADDLFDQPKPECVGHDRSKFWFWSAAVYSAAFSFFFLFVEDTSRASLLSDPKIEKRKAAE
jgi:hypothetical protein